MPYYFVNPRAATLPTKEEFENIKAEKKKLEAEYELLQQRLQTIIKNGQDYRYSVGGHFILIFFCILKGISDLKILFPILF